VKYFPILMADAMVRAILRDVDPKTHTRRPVKQRPGYEGYSRVWSPLAVGDRLWVREAFDPVYAQDELYNDGEPIAIDYRADAKRNRMCDEDGTRRWKPSIHMPRSACRIFLEITEIRAERLQDISEADAAAEGWQRRDDISTDQQVHTDAARDWFMDLWDSVYGRPRPGADYSWAANPMVWVIEFKRI
jgi:hypothetical protein